MIPETIKLMVMVTRASRVDFKGDKGDSIHRLDSMEISSIRVGFVGRDFFDGECLGCLTYQNWELESVSRLIGRSYYASNYVSLYSANYVSLNPRLLTAFLAIFVVKPASIGCRRKAGRISGKVKFNCTEWASALFNESFENGCQFRILETAENAGKRWGFSNQALHYCFSTIGHEAPTGRGGVDFIGYSEYGIRQEQFRSPEGLRRLRDTTAKVTKQDDKIFLFMGLSLVVGGPVLRVVSHYWKSSFLSSVHLSPHLVITISIYYQGLTCQYLWYILLVNSNGNYRWEILTRKNRANLKLQPIGVAADMNGFPAIKMNALEFVRNAKVRIGTSPEGQKSIRTSKVFLGSDRCLCISKNKVIE